MKREKTKNIFNFVKASVVFFTFLSLFFSISDNLVFAAGSIDISPNSGRVGDIVKITGFGFSDLKDVLFGKIQATVTSRSPTLPTGYLELGVTVPVGATTGKISIETKSHGTVVSSTDFTIDASVAPTDLKYYYLNDARLYKGPYNTIVECNTALNKDKLAAGSSRSSGFGDCKQITTTEVQNSPYYSPFFDTTPVAITGTPSPANFGIYNLLAPIGNFKSLTSSDNIGTYFNTIFLIAIGLCGVLAVIMFIIGGIQYMGDESIFGKTKGKEQMESAILGLLIALGSYALLNTINPDLLGGKGVNISQVSAEIQDETETAPWEGSSVGDNTKLCPGGYGDISTSWGDAAHKKINVCKTLISKTNEMILAAKEAGFLLTGSGSRTFKEQTDIWNRKNCNPPGTVNCSKIVAKPGTSMHESGFAIDFRCDNKAIGKQEYNNRCVVWLAKNAINYGFKNLPGEAWHWSTGPKAGH